MGDKTSNTVSLGISIALITTMMTVLISEHVF